MINIAQLIEIQNEVLKRKLKRLYDEPVKDRWLDRCDRAGHEQVVWLK
jgi:hypothetical protein